jgi:uncharacterized protein YndB with AHSA1/START domain
MTPAFHGSFTLERLYDATPARVFKAFADPRTKARWFRGPMGWEETRREMDFRQGGEEIAGGKFPHGLETLFVARYHEIVPDARIVYAYDMHLNGAFVSVSLATIEIVPQDGKTLVRFTEQGVFLDGDANANDHRREGTQFILETIAPIVEADA